jgi:hypothetical protein
MGEEDGRVGVCRGDAMEPADTMEGKGEEQVTIGLAWKLREKGEPVREEGSGGIKDRPVEGGP